MLAFYRLLEVTREINSQYLFLRIEQWRSVHQINITQFSVEEKEQFSEYEFSKSKKNRGVVILWELSTINYLQGTTSPEQAQGLIFFEIYFHTR